MVTASREGKYTINLIFRTKTEGKNGKKFYLLERPPSELQRALQILYSSFAANSLDFFRILRLHICSDSPLQYVLRKIHDLPVYVYIYIVYRYSFL